MIAEKKRRNSGFEAVRVVAMLMIIAYHYVVHGTTIEIVGGGVQKYFWSVLLCGEKRALICFA